MNIYVQVIKTQHACMYTHARICKPTVVLDLQLVLWNEIKWNKWNLKSLKEEIMENENIYTLTFIVNLHS